MRKLIIGAIYACLFAAQANAASITVGFPSEDSIINGYKLLDAGGGGFLFQTGANIEETFLDTGLPFSTSSRWVFDMSNYTTLGITNSFDVLINGNKIGDFNFTSDGSTNTLSFDLSFNYEPIVGDDFTLRMVATSTVIAGEGSWNWLPDGSVTLSNVPITPAVWLFGSGLIGLIGIARRKKV